MSVEVQEICTTEENEKKEQRQRNYFIDLGELTPHNIKQLRIINQTVFPVTYNAKFYRDVLEVGDLAKLAYFNDIVVGAVCCRVDTLEGGVRKLYIMTLGCLAPYRRLGMGTLMLEHVFSVCARDPTLSAIYLHVQVNNDGALGFYRKFGFSIVEKTENYYKRIYPQDAFLLEKKLTPMNNSLVNGDESHAST